MTSPRRDRRSGFLCAALLLCAGGAARGDDLSGADKLRVIWSNQFAFTPEGIPVVTVGLADGLKSATVGGAGGRGVRLLPEGEGGAEVRAGKSWKVRLRDGKPAVIQWHVVVATGTSSDADRVRLRSEGKKWRERGYRPKTIELGSLFGLRGEVIDMRRLLVGISPKKSRFKARAEARAIKKRFKLETALHAEIAERPRGMLEAVDENGTVVRNAGVMWFAPERQQGALSLHAESTSSSNRGGHGGWENARRRTYGGMIYLTVGRDGKMTAANAVPEDKLLAGLLPAEMGASAPKEALKAQAVAARNELFAKLGTRHLTDPYRLCSEVHCQVYAGAGREDPRSTRAVQATRGELMVRADGSVVDAVYSASCGGHTETNEMAWGTEPDPSLRGVLDVDAAHESKMASFSRVTDVDAFLRKLPATPACSGGNGSSAFRWSKRVEASVLEAKVEVGAIRNVVVLERGVSGRAVRMRVEGTKGSKEISRELTIRRAFGGLKSSMFVFDVERDPRGLIRAFNFKGGGYGHGVGMCQRGAMGMARAGRDYRAILGRYYRNATVRKLY